VEHAVIEACGLLAEAEPEVLLVVYDCPMPKIYAAFQDCHEQPYAWAWLMRPPADDLYSLSWRATEDIPSRQQDGLPAGLEVLRFHLRKDAALERTCDRRRWLWTRHAA
jgi:Beta-ketoacyl synthase, N-terminal domain